MISITRDGIEFTLPSSAGGGVITAAELYAREPSYADAPPPAPRPASPPARGIRPAGACPVGRSASIYPSERHP